MYVNPFPFGIFLGVIGTLIAEILGIIIWANCDKGDKK